jgi:hypothetical protein
LKSYEPGLITIIDKKIEVILDDGATWECDVNDVRGVALDEVPLAKEIAVGTNVIALLKEGEPMQRGVVAKVMESSDTESPNVLIRFSSGQEEVKPFEYIRLLRSVKQGGERTITSHRRLRPCYTRVKDPGFINLRGFLVSTSLFDNSHFRSTQKAGRFHCSVGEITRQGALWAGFHR